jgi:8-oxo-dGTP diphosphatase
MAINNDPDIHNLVICANVFIRRGNKFLVLQRSPQKRWAAGVVHPVGGKVDLGEDPITAAQREAREEAGVAVKNLSLMAVILEIDPVKTEPGNWMIFHFVGDYDSGEVTQTEEGELLWLTQDEIKQARLFPSVQAVIGHMFDQTTGPVFARFEYKTDSEINMAEAHIYDTAK